MEYIVPLMLGMAASFWRLKDGSDSRYAHSNLYAFGLVLIAGLWASIGTHILDASPSGSLGLSHLLLPVVVDKWPLVIPVLIVGWLMVRGMPGWDHYFPHRNDAGERKSGMLLGFAVPIMLSGGIYVLLTQLTPASILYSLSGVLVALIYVHGSRLEERLMSQSSGLPFFTAEEWGRLSYGFMVGGLASLH